MRRGRPQRCTSACAKCIPGAARPPREFTTTWVCDTCDGSDERVAIDATRATLPSRRVGRRLVGRRDAGDQHIVLAGDEHLAAMLLEVLAIERDVLDEQAELWLA